LAEFTGYTAHRTPLDWSPDGRRLAEADPVHPQFGDWHELRVYVLRGDPGGLGADGLKNSVALQDFSKVPGRRPFTAAAFSPDGTSLAVAPWDDSAVVVPADRKTTKTSDLSKISGSFDSDSPAALAWSPDGAWLAVGTTTDIAVWSSDTRQVAFRLDHKDTAELAWDPSGTNLASGGLGETVHVWKAEERTLHISLEGHSLGVIHLSWSPSGQTLSTLDAGGKLRLWDANDGRLLKVLNSAWTSGN